jgi:SagB-type dehydrogenase family enzyme
VATPLAFYRYLPEPHALEVVAAGDLRSRFDSSSRQPERFDAPAVFLVAADHARTAARYGKRDARRYVWMEAGHAAQNLLLQAAALDLAGVPLGAFDPDTLQTSLALPEEHRPVYLVPLGHPVNPIRPAP